MFTQGDLALIEKKGMTAEQVEKQLEQFRNGFPYLKLRAAASVGDGILALTTEEQDKMIACWEQYKKEGGHRITKFVPASGAASRMFKNVFEFVDGENDAPTTDFEKTFFNRLHDFAFFPALDDACNVMYNMGADALVEEGRYKDVATALLDVEGLAYAKLPKGLLQFHAYDDETRTPLEEHLVEAALYATADGKADVHFTVSPEHRPLFEALVDRVKGDYEKKYGISYNVSFSEQKASTDTIAAAEGGAEPFRQADGSLLFRPGGHGALIQNLNELPSDVIFIKNIDNVVPDRLKESTVRWKQVIAGVLVSLQKQAQEYIALLDGGIYSHDQIMDIVRFVRHSLFIEIPGLKDMEDADLVVALRRKLNRPMRVCGMVRNVGEPGGGPFLAQNPDGTFSPQILESSQIDKDNEEYMKMFQQGTHFNPVDLVCAITGPQGKAYDLTQYVDPQTGFISHKSKDGRELLALELPGLWNGAMSDWSTVFVEVPLDTFNPVKTVNDLLREQHQ